MLVACPQCGAPVRAPSIGADVYCGTCGNHFTVTQQSIPPVQPPAQTPSAQSTPPQAQAIPPIVRTAQTNDYQFSVASHKPTSTAKHTFGGGFGLSTGFGVGCIVVAVLAMLTLIGCNVALIVVNRMMDRMDRPETRSTYYP